MELPGHADEVFSVDWSPGGDRVASGGKDKILKMYHFRNLDGDINQCSRNWNKLFAIFE
jgi:WD40 repeat protein